MSIDIFDRIETPAVIIDKDKLDTNIRDMQALAARHQLKLRPHIKTHKSVKIAGRQIATGASGIAASKVDEALVFIKAEIRSVTVAHPVLTPSKLDRLLATAREFQTDLRIIIDSSETLGAIALKAKEHKFKVGIYIKIDVGLHRCGLREGDDRILKFAKEIDADPSIAFCGLLSHAGHAYGAADKAGVAKVAEEERLMMLRIKESIEKQCVPVPEISVGSTPTVIAAESFEGITEVRPGNYVFLDLNPVDLGVCEEKDVALSILSTVISKNSDYFIIDAGAKTLALDQGAHGSTARIGNGVGYTLDKFAVNKDALVIAKLSEEHGFVDRNGVDLPLGTKIRIIPNHSCPVANLARQYVVITESDMTYWPIDASKFVR